MKTIKVLIITKVTLQKSQKIMVLFFSPIISV